MIKRLPLLSLFLFSMLFAQAPDPVVEPDPTNNPVHITANGDKVVRCLTEEMEMYWALKQKLNDNLNKREQFERWVEQQETSRISIDNDQVLYIPVVFHVVHNGSGVGSATNISVAALQSQLDVLNEDFRRISGTNGYNTHPDGADTRIEFVMARRTNTGGAFPGGEDGIDRISGPANGWGGGPYTTNFIDNTIKPATSWDADKYFNIWVCRISGGILGYAVFPEAAQPGMGCNPGNAARDGVVLLNTSIGKSSVTGFSGPYNEGRTATHEVGHWLGLRHIWGDGGCGVDDFCSDTPWSDAANYGCPNHNSCGSTDMVENYMDYTDDLCMDIFTLDQKKRMRIVLMNSPRRKGLITSEAIYPPAANDAGITDIQQPQVYSCNTSIIPEILLKNFGSATLISADIQYQVDGGPVQVYNWTGSIAPGIAQLVTLPVITGLSASAHVLNVSTTAPNASADVNTANDAYSRSFTVGAGQSIPYTEDFEEQFFPPTGWAVVDPDDDCYTWIDQGVYEGPSGGPTNTAFFPGYDYNSPGNYDELVSPAIDLTTATSATLDFDVAYRRYDNGSDERLRVLVSTDCGASFSAVPYNKVGGTLSTSSNTTSEFIPDNTGQWRHETVNLDSYVGNIVVLKFEATTDYGNNLLMDNVSVTGVVPMPVEFLSFLGKPENNAIRLDWETMEDGQNKGFQVQRFNGHGFENISWVPARSGVSGDQAYAFMDYDVQAGNIYRYRLSQVDLDGGKTLSNIVEVSLEGLDSKVGLNLYPNPANAICNIEMVIPESGPVEILVFNQIGQIVTNLSTSLEVGRRTVQLNLEDFPKGVYHVKVSQLSEQVSGKLIVR